MPSMFVLITVPQTCDSLPHGLIFLKIYEIHEVVFREIL